MKKILAVLLLGFIFILGAKSNIFAQANGITELVDNFQKATDLQRSQILEDSLGREISVSAIVSNVGEYNFFNTADDIGKIYYQVSTEQQKTKNNVPYEIVFLFKEKKQIKDISKGWTMQQAGKIIRIIDERLQISLWLLCADLTEEDKVLFKQIVE